MNSCERFKNRNSKRMEAREILNTHYIFKGYPSIWLENIVKQDNKTITTSVLANVVNQQEKDKAYIYTTIDDSLDIGSVWGAKGLHWLIAEEIITIKDVTWHKYLAYLCNINVENTWGYFKGPEKNYINIKNEYGASLESLQKPVLVLPENVLGFADKIVIHKRPWLVQEWDAISSPGLVYYSLRATTVSKEVAAEHENDEVYIEHVSKDFTPIIIEPEKEKPLIEDKYIIGHDIDIELTTEGGYFTFDNKQIKIKKHTGNLIVFSIPFGVDKVTVGTKLHGEIVEETYTAK